MRRVLGPVLFFSAIAAVWEFGVAWFDVPRYLLPPLSRVASAAWETRDEIVSNAVVTAGEVLGGFLLATFVGVGLGALIHASALARRTLYPLVTAFNGMPKIALAPLLVVWFGYGFTSKVVASFVFAAFPIVVATVGGLAATPLVLDEHFRALGATTWDTFWRLRLPAALPSITDGLKIGMPLAVIGATVGEFVGAERGLGYLILFATTQARIDLVFAGIMAVTLLSVAFSWIVDRASRAVWWRANS